MPDWVWVPVHRAAVGDGTTRVQLDPHVRDGAPLVWVFTSRAGLVAALGAAQPWTLVDADRLRRLLAAQGLDQVVLDPDPTPDDGEQDGLYGLTA